MIGKNIIREEMVLLDERNSGAIFVFLGENNKIRTKIEQKLALVQNREKIFGV